MGGWIKLHRQIQEHWIWQDPQKLKWWLDILLLANHQDNKSLLGNEIVEYKRGEYHTSELILAKRWGVNRKTVRRFLDLLEAEKMVTLTRSRVGSLRGTTIKISNYATYQAFSEEQEDNKRDIRRDNKRDINKNEKNDKEIYNSDFDEIWSLYPRKEGKAGARKSYEKLRKKYSKEELIRCVNRYASKVADTEKKYIKQGSTFFNGGYEDYLDNNYKESTPEITNPAYKPFEYD